MGTQTINSTRVIIQTGRRKSAIARVQLSRGTGTFTVNKKPAIQYMHENAYLIDKMQVPLAFLDFKNQFDIHVQVNGGGLVGQANAIQLGIARALCILEQGSRTPLKSKGLLTRDARIKERKKYGLKKARKSPQYSKR